MPFDPPLTPTEVQAALGNSYAVQRAIQTGGQGAVFLVEQAGQVLALKIYHADQLEERLDREVQALKAIKSPSLVQLQDFGSCTLRGQSCRFLSTTFIEGDPLDRVVANQSPIALNIVARIGHDVAVAIHTMWASRIVHRDIKPNNIMLTTSSGAVLIDLGVARHLNHKTLTTAGKTWGTMGYLSPEQSRGVALTCKSDVFALGIVMQELLLGRHPTGYRQQHLLGGGVATNGLRPGLPRALVQLVDEMVSKNAIARPLPSAVSRDLKPLAGLVA